MTPTNHHSKNAQKNHDAKTPAKPDAASKPESVAVAETPKAAVFGTEPGTTAAPMPDPVPKVEEGGAGVEQSTEDAQEQVVHEPQPVKKADESNEKKPFTIQVPVGTMKLLAVISRVEGKSISEIILQAVAQADLKGRAKKALEALAREIE